MEWDELIRIWIIVCPLVFLGGLIDAVAGGGGLITLPAYLLAGLPPHLASGTNKCGNFFGTLIATGRFLKRGDVHLPSALAGGAGALVGAWLGARLNMIMPEQALYYLMLAVVPVMAVFLLFKRDFGTEDRSGELGVGKLVPLSLAIGLVIGCYDGFFGPGAGTFLTLAFTGLCRFDLLTAAGNTKVANATSNLASLVTFALGGKVLWAVGIPAALFGIAGGYVGAGLALKGGAKVIRPMFFVVLTLLVVRLRTQKLLGRTVLILLAFSLLTVGGSYLFVRGEMVSRYREQGMEGTMSMLQRTSTSLDRTIQALELQIQTFWKDDDVSSLLVAPEKPDFSRTSGAAAQIQGLREGNELIERCWLYLYQSGQILTDRQLLLEAGDPERPGQLERWSAAAESGTPSLWCEDGKIYLLVAFPQPKKLGLLIVQLSARDLFEQFQEGWSGLSGDPVYVYDGAGEPVFPNRMTYPEREELMVTGESPREGVYALSGQRDTVVCVARSQTAGWYCLTYWNSGDWLPSPQEILTAFLPAAAVLLLLILILSLVILQVIYRPIQRIVESMLTGQETEAGQDEAGLISAALARGQRENQRLTGLLSDVRPALAQRFFQSLLEGGQTEPEEVSRMLAALESPFPLEGTYLVLAVEAVPERSASAVEGEIYTRSLWRSLKRFWEGRCLAQIQPAPGGGLSAVLCASPPVPGGFAIPLEDCRQALERETRDFPFSAAVGASQARGSLLELSAAWQEARQDLNYRKYCCGEAGQPGPGPVGAGVYDAQVREMLQKALSGELEGARAQLADLRQAVGRAQSPVQMRSMLRGCVLTQVLKVQRELGERYSAACAADSPDFWQEQERLLAELDEWGHNSQRGYMDRARDYIAAHFSDSGLSLNEVSGHVGLSVSYLSSLFSKYQPPGFSHYLRQYRVEQARLLLESTDASVTEIGYQTGFNSSNSFIRTFKSLVGETPGRYRERCQGGKYENGKDDDT